MENCVAYLEPGKLPRELEEQKERADAGIRYPNWKKSTSGRLKNAAFLDGGIIYTERWAPRFFVNPKKELDV